MRLNKSLRLRSHSSVINILNIPKVFLLNPKGSFDPVGILFMPKYPTKSSSLSAKDTMFDIKFVDISSYSDTGL